MHTSSAVLGALSEMDVYSVIPPQPLGDYLRGLLTVVSEHAARLEQVAEQQSVARVEHAALADRVAALSAALQQARQQHEEELKVRGDRLEALEQDLKRARKRETRAVFDTVALHTEAGLRRRFLQKAVAWTRRRNRDHAQERRYRLLKSMVRGDEELRERYHGKALRWLQQHCVAERKRRCAQLLHRSSDLGVRRAYLEKCLRWVRLQDPTAQRLLRTALNGTDSGLRRTYLGKALRWTRRTAWRARIQQWQEGRVGKALMHRYYRKWLTLPPARRASTAQLKHHAEARRRRDQLAAGLRLANQNIVRRRYFARLKIRRRLRRQRRAQLRGVQDMARRMGNAHARGRYLLWHAFVRQRVRVREKDLVHQLMEVQRDAAPRGQVDELAARHAALNVQVDVGLRTLTNTNTVLNKLVDRLISVDEQLEHLDRDKLSRTEFAAAELHAAAASPLPSVVRHQSPPRGPDALRGAAPPPAAPPPTHLAPPPPAALPPPPPPTHCEFALPAPAPPLPSGERCTSPPRPPVHSSLEALGRATYPQPHAQPQQWRLLGRDTPRSTVRGSQPGTPGGTPRRRHPAGSAQGPFDGRLSDPGDRGGRVGPYLRRAAADSGSTSGWQPG